MASRKKEDMRLIELVANIEKYLIIQNYKKDELATKLSMSLSSLYNKLKDPRKFTFGEILTLIEILRFTEAERQNLLMKRAG